ncbi:signal recognition particle-docking protein FtsY [Kribbella sp. GL6]|uniref:signal recognition particle-docking protein FtsY n=1 Tax=Kribbella sp. GL6 TaxID=3419765 RepID=UPI003CFBFF60
MLTPQLVSLLTDQALITIVVVIAVVLVVGTTGLVVARRRRGELPSATKPAVEAPETTPGTTPETTAEPQVGDDAEAPRDTATRTLEDTELPETTLEKPESAQGRLVRLRARLARSQGSLGKGLLALLSRDKLDEEAWEDIETTLITADVGVAPTQELVEKLRTRMRVEGVGADQARQILREELVDLVDPSMDRSIKASRRDGQPAVILMVGVNGTGKTTTVGRLARVLIAEDKHVVLGAADTFRAAAADQLQTWGERVGARTVRGPEGGDPASIAFDSVKEGIAEEADVVLIDTAGRLHTKTGLMDELGKVKRVIEKSAEVDEVLLVIDATTGQNGLTQARVFAEVIDVTGLVLTKLDGTAKGGIVIAVQRELGVPVKLVGLGEGADDLAPFDPEQFVDALLD